MERFSHIQPVSWFREGLYTAQSLIQGTGVFTELPILAGEVVIRWGGVILSQEEFASGKGLQHSNVGIDEGIVLAQASTSSLGLDDFMNHSCEPNLGLSDEVTLVAMVDIEAVSELTIDYAMEIGNEDYQMKQGCNCQSKLCRIKITGNDWRIDSLQKRYAGYFSPFIARRIKNLIP